MALLGIRLRKAEERLGVGNSDVEVYKEAYKRYCRGDDRGEALRALPPYKPRKGAPTSTELLILAMAEVHKEAQLKGVKFTSWLLQEDRGSNRNERP